MDHYLMHSKCVLCFVSSTDVFCNETLYTVTRE